VNRKALLGVVFPIVVLLGWLGQLVWLERTGAEVRLPVRGFDPRDLLAGHYLTYAVDYGPLEICAREGYVETESTCVCLAQSTVSRLHEASWAGACSERVDACPVFIKGTCNAGRFEADIERFYFPETYSSELAVVPEQSSIEVSLTASGQGLVTGFYVGDVELVKYAKTRAQAP
jgi:uncharacterized membrane-anchored protein